MATSHCAMGSGQRHAKSRSTKTPDSYGAREQVPPGLPGPGGRGGTPHPLGSPLLIMPDVTLSDEHMIMISVCDDAE